MPFTEDEQREARRAAIVRALDLRGVEVVILDSYYTALPPVRMHRFELKSFDYRNSKPLVYCGQEPEPAAAIDCPPPKDSRGLLETREQFQKRRAREKTHEQVRRRPPKEIR